MTAGRGIQHSEMFPLLHQDQDNHLELLQVWINLPQKNKMVPAEYKMFWAEDIPQKYLDNNKIKIDIISGDFFDTQALAPPQYSWANNPKNNVAVWLIEMQEASQFELPLAQKEVHRTLYFYSGSELFIDNTEVHSPQALRLAPDLPCSISNASNKVAKLLILQGHPINEPVSQYGPFVMNT